MSRKKSGFLKRTSLGHCGPLAVELVGTVPTFGNPSTGLEVSLAELLSSRRFLKTRQIVTVGFGASYGGILSTLQMWPRKTVDVREQRLPQPEEFIQTTDADALFLVNAAYFGNRELTLWAQRWLGTKRFRGTLILWRSFREPGTCWINPPHPHLFMEMHHLTEKQILRFPNKAPIGAEVWYRAGFPRDATRQFRLLMEEPHGRFMGTITACSLPLR